MIGRKLAWFAWVASLLYFLHVSAYAGDVWPTKTVKIVVPYAPGGIVDVRARFIADKLSREIGQAVVVENRPGASTVIGMDAVAKSPADGHTLLITSGNTFIYLPLLLPQLPFDPIKDFLPLTQYSATPFVVVVNPSLGVRTLADFFSLARRKPGQLTYSSAGGGTFTNIAGELVRHAGKVEITHVPYKGDAPALTDVMAGHINMTIGFPVTVAEHVRSGRLIALMQSGATRSRVLPNVPTAKEAGFPELALVPFGGFWVSAKTPQSVVSKIHESLAKVLRSPEHVKSLEDSGSEVRVSNPAEFGQFLEVERARWAEIIGRTGVKIDQ